MSRSRSPRQNRATRRLTIPGLGLIVLVISVRVGSVGSTVDPEIIALVLVALLVVLAIGILTPMLTMRRVRVAASSPADIVFGDEVEVEVTLTGRADRVSVRLLDPASPWFRTSSPAVGHISHQAAERGVFAAVRVEVQTSWPLGLFSAGLVRMVTLARPVYVAPRPVPMTVVPRPRPDPVSQVLRTSAAMAGDAVRSVRPYEMGDPPRLVHWPSSARAGSLVVRELEPPARTALVVVVDLRSAPLSGFGAAPVPTVEAAVARAAGLVVSGLRAGSEVILSTFELDGPHIGPVGTVAQAGHRLAAVVPGEPPSAPAGWPVEVVQP